MVRGLSDGRPGTSRLERLLADLAGTAVPESKQPLAERVGLWLEFEDNLSLYAALNSPPAGAATRHPAESATARLALDRVRSALASATAIDTMPDIATEEGAPTAWAEDEPDAFAPYRRHYIARQREMGASIAPLRATLRAALARQSGALARLATLDGVLDNALVPRERALLATVPDLLSRRFDQLRRSAPPPDNWQEGFRRDMRAVLLAELDFRLQPLAGLIAALDQEVSKQQ